jgi:subtilase family serine protease
LCTGWLRRGAILAGLLLGGLLLGGLPGCGRSPLSVGDAALDELDRGPAPEGVRPCTPTCTEICTLRKNCALLPKSGFEACVAGCEAAPSLPTNLCLGQIACRGGLVSCKEVQTCISSPTLPDLLLSSFTASSSSAGALTFAVQVCNQGSASAPASSLHLYLNRVKAPALQESGDRVVKLPGLPPGGCASHTSVESVAGGTYQSWVQADAENGILESSESNNLSGPVLTKVGGAALADLTVSSLTASASSGMASYVARVCNVGSAPAGATKLDIYVNRSTPPPVGLLGEASTSVSPLAPGSCQQLILTAVPIGDGTQSSWALVDRPGLIAEHSESNNAFGPITIAVADLPDLVVTTVNTGGSGNTASFTATVCNQGKVASAPVDLSFYAHRATAPDASSLPTSSKTIGALPAGTCAASSWFHGYPSAGIYSAWIWVDRLGAQPEIDEKNTFGPVKVVVGGGLPDLTLSLTAASGSGGIVSYTASVCNKGLGTSSGAALDLYYHAPSPPAAFVVGDQTSAVPPIAPGDCTQIKLVASLATGTYKSRAWIDRAALVQETSESNNLTDPITVSVNAGLGPDLVVSSLTTFVNLSNVYYYVSVCNAGTGYSSVTAVELYHDRPTAPTLSSVGDQSKSVISLGTGGCTSFTFVTTLPKGSYQAWAYVDRADLSKETNETNNTKGPVLVNVSLGQGVDLVVSGMSFDALTGSYKITVCNKGGGASWPSYVDLYYNRSIAPKSSEKGDATLPVASLLGGGCATLTHTAKLAAGSYSSWAYVDRLAQVPESDETNNLYGPLLFAVGNKPDLALTGLSAQTAAGGVVSYSITLCNKGSAASGSCYLSLYYDLPAAPTASNKADGSIFLGGLMPGVCTSFSWIGKLPPGSHSSWAWVDSTGMVSELDESNNLGGPIKVQVGPADPCQTICETLVSPCGLLPQAQLASCVSSCKGRSQIKIDCALLALSQGKCLEIVSCLFS